MKKEFNKAEYISDYKKNHYKAFKVDLKNEEMESLVKALKTENVTKAEFLRRAIRKECIENNVLYFDRVAKCDWCGKRDIVAVTQYGTSRYNRLICSDCASETEAWHKNLDGTTLNWYRKDN